MTNSICKCCGEPFSDERPRSAKNENQCVQCTYPEAFEKGLANPFPNGRWMAAVIVGLLIIAVGFVYGACAAASFSNAPTISLRYPTTSETTLTTNWLATSVSKPNGDGSNSSIAMEVSSVTESTHVILVSDGMTNRILVASRIRTDLLPQVRQAPPIINITNITWSTLELRKPFYSTNFSNLFQD